MKNISDYINESEERKALLIKNAPQSFANFLMAMNIPYRWSYGEFIIENTSGENKFKNYCLRNGVRSQDIEKMEFSETVIF